MNSPLLPLLLIIGVGTGTAYPPSTSTSAQLSTSEREHGTIGSKIGGTGTIDVGGQLAGSANVGHGSLLGGLIQLDDLKTEGNATGRLNATGTATGEFGSWGGSEYRGGGEAGGYGGEEPEPVGNDGGVGYAAGNEVPSAGYVGDDTDPEIPSPVDFFGGEVPSHDDRIGGFDFGNLASS